MQTKFVRNRWPIVLGLAVVVAVVWITQAGNLDPPGPPAPTMKTLDEVEPRIPIHASDLPLTITEPGSYYLAENITDATQGITIGVGKTGVDNVTIDLMGFELSGAVGNTSRGIYAVFGSEKTVVKNGTISGWGLDGIYLHGAMDSGSMLRNLRVSGNGDAGLQLGSNVIVDSCTVLENVGNGVSTIFGAVITDTISKSNGGSGFIVGGEISGSVASSNGGDGIRVGGGSIRDSSSWGNGGAGISATGNANVLYSNSFSNVGAGIFVNGSDNRIEGNTVSLNDIGIDVDSTANVIIKNTASNNTTLNYEILPGNDAGPIGTAATSTSPWANIGP